MNELRQLPWQSGTWVGGFRTFTSSFEKFTSTGSALSRVFQKISLKKKIVMQTTRKIEK